MTTGKVGIGLFALACVFGLATPAGAHQPGYVAPEPAPAPVDPYQHTLFLIHEDNRTEYYSPYETPLYLGLSENASRSRHGSTSVRFDGSGIDCRLLGCYGSDTRVFDVKAGYVDERDFQLVDVGGFSGHAELEWDMQRETGVSWDCCAGPYAIATLTLFANGVPHHGPDIWMDGPHGWFSQDVHYFSYFSGEDQYVDENGTYAAANQTDPPSEKRNETGGAPDPANEVWTHDLVLHVEITYYDYGVWDQPLGSNLQVSFDTSGRNSITVQEMPPAPVKEPAEPAAGNETTEIVVEEVASDEASGEGEGANSTQDPQGRKPTVIHVTPGPELPLLAAGIGTVAFLMRRRRNG